MERRARRWRLPLAVRIGALPALVAIAAAFAFGFSQSNAAPASKKLTGYRAAVFPSGVDLNDLPPNQDLRVTFDVGFECGFTCRIPTGTILAMLRKDDGNFDWDATATLTENWSWEDRNRNVAVVHSNPITIPAGKLAPGKYRLHHRYGGDEYFEGTEQPQDKDPLLAVSSTYKSHFSMSTAPNPSKAGEPITLSASYDGAYVGAVPSGRVFFYLNGSYFTGANLKDGKAAYNTKNSGKTVPVGQSTWTVRYSGDSKFRGFESAGWTHTVDNTTETTTELTVTPNPMPAGTNAHFKIKVTAKSGTAVPTDDFEVALGNGGSSFVGHLNDKGEHEDDSPVGPPGDYSIVATYKPTGAFSASQSAPVKVTVVKATSTTAVTVSPEAARPGKPVTLAAKVDTTGTAVGGDVTFTDGDVKLGGCATANGRCEITTDKLTQLGKRTVTATYTGYRDVAGSSGTATVRVSESSTTSLTATPGSITVGSPVALAAQVAGGPAAGGKVTFLDGASEIGKSDVDKDGKAAFNTSALAVGTHELTARFEGTDALDLSTSEQVSVQVNAAGTPGQGGGSQNGGSSGGGGGGTAGGSGGTPQPKNLASTGADIGVPLWGGAALVILGAVAVTLGRRRRRSSR
jgi:hypothetical protein